MNKPGNDPGDQGRALLAGNADDGMRPFSLREQTVHDRLANRRGPPSLASDACAAGPGIHFDDGAALFFERARDVLGGDVDAADVQAFHAGGERDDRIDIG